MNSPLLELSCPIFVSILKFWTFHQFLVSKIILYGISKFVVIPVMSYEVPKDNYVMSKITLWWTRIWLRVIEEQFRQNFLLPQPWFCSSVFLWLAQLCYCGVHKDSTLSNSMHFKERRIKYEHCQLLLCTYIHKHLFLLICEFYLKIFVSFLALRAKATTKKLEII